MGSKFPCLYYSSREEYHYSSLDGMLDQLSVIPIININRSPKGLGGANLYTWVPGWRETTWSKVLRG